MLASACNEESRLVHHLCLLPVDWRCMWPVLPRIDPHFRCGSLGESAGQVAESHERSSR